MRLVRALLYYKVKKFGILYDSLNIKIFKIKDNIDWNYPFTSENNIILSKEYINNILNDININNLNLHLNLNENKNKNEIYHEIKNIKKLKWNDVRINIRPILSYVTTLCHEVIHIFQRNYDFTNIYKKVWGFTKINKDNIVNNYFNTLENPDGYNFELVIYFKGKWLLPLLIFNINVSAEPVNIICEVYFTNNGKIILTQNWCKIEQYPPFYKAFYSLGQGHPNEILAYILSQWIITDSSVIDETIYYHGKYIYDFL